VIFEEDQIQPSTIVDSTGTNTASVSAAGAVKTDGSAVTQPVSATSLPLPTGAATSALQSTGNTSIASIDTKTPALGQATMAASTPVVLASNQSAIPVTVSGGGPISDITATGTITSNQTVTLTGLAGYSSVGISISGTWTGSISVEGSVDGVSFDYLNATPLNSGLVSYTWSANGNFLTNCSGLASVRLRGTVVTSGTATITIRANATTGPVILSASLPQGVNNIGNINVSNFPATQPVSGSVSVSNFPATQPVSGTVAATQSGTWTVQPGNTANTTPWLVSQANATLWVTGTAATGVALTVTLPAVSTFFHYINHIEIQAYSTAARTGGATPIVVTSTNLPGSPAWTFATAATIGSTDSKIFIFADSIRSSVVNTATTIVCPATTGVIWRVNISYYAGA